MLQVLLRGLIEAKGRQGSVVLIRPNPYVWAAFESTVGPDLPQLLRPQTRLSAEAVGNSTVTHDIRGARGELRREADYQRERLALYRAKVHSSRATSVAHLRQRERECAFAEDACAGRSKTRD